MILRSRPVYLTLILLAVVALLLALYSQHDGAARSLTELVSQRLKPGKQTADADPAQPTPPPWAYATFLSTRVEGEDQDGGWDPYFTATRVLAYQLLHQESTRTRLGIPLLVLVPPHVSARKRAVLAAEGAVVVPVDAVEPAEPWLRPLDPRYADQFTKLRLFEQTRYQRILYMDSDMLVTRNLDGIFDEDVARAVQPTRPADDADADADDEDSNTTNRKKKISVRPPLPDPPPDYLIAGTSDTRSADHPFPPPESDQMNGGFILLRPDPALLAYYRALLDTPRSFDSTFMEQALLNHVHARGGRMPWAALAPPGRWSANWPNQGDLDGGCATLHDKFWQPGNQDWIARPLVEMWWRVQGRAEGFWQRQRADDDDAKEPS